MYIKSPFRILCITERSSRDTNSKEHTRVEDGRKKDRKKRRTEEKCFAWERIKEDVTVQRLCRSVFNAVTRVD